MKYINQSFGNWGGGASAFVRASSVLAILAACLVSARGATINVPGDHATIQAAVAAASAGDMILVGPGTYAESFTVNKTLTLRGPNHAISPNTGARTPEATITGIVSASTSVSSEIVIEGFRFFGATPFLTNGSPGAVHNDFVFRKNLVEGNSSQVSIFTASPVNTATALIDDNRFLGMVGNAMQIVAIGSIEVTITDNVVDGTGNSGINADSISNSIISGNVFANTSQQGVQIAGTSSDVTVSGNTFTNNNISAGADRGAIRIYGSTFTGPVIFSDNEIIGGNTAFAVRNGENITGKNIQFTGNTMTGVNGTVVHHGGSGALDANYNYWGSAAGPGGLVTGDVNAAIFYTDGGLSNVSAPVTNVTASTFFATIQAAINAASAGDEIDVSAGTFNEDVLINKSLTLGGAGVANTTIVGPIGGSGNTVQIAASDVELSGFTITRDGNNTTDWNNGALNSAGIALQSAVIGGVVIHDNLITGMRTGIDINNTSGITIRNNVVTNNRTGMILRNTTDHIVVVENEITGNWTVGILFLDASGGTNSPLQQSLASTFNNNNITGNWYGQIVDRQTGGSLPIPGGNLKNFTGNWLGTPSPVVSVANSAEPGYAAQIPVVFGGSAVAPLPGSQPDIAGTASANVKFAPLLFSAVDLDVDSGTGWGTYGFQGDQGTLDALVKNVTNAPGVTLYYETIQLAINAASPGDIITAAAGTYAENLIVDRPVSLRGPNAGINPNTDVRLPEAIIVPAIGSVTDTVIMEIEAPDVTIDGFVLDGDNPALTSGFLGTNGADLDAACGVYLYRDGMNNLVVTNNVIQNMSYFGALIYGVSGNPATTGSVVSENLIRNLGTYDAASGIDRWGGGVLLYNDQYVRVVDNVIQNVRIGVQTGNYSRANPGVADYAVIGGNAIEARRVAIFHNLHYSLASPFTISGNEVSGLSHGSETLVRGVLLGSLSVGSVLEDNVVDMSGVSGAANGYEVWNVKASSPAQISGGTITGATIGLFLNNFEGYNSNATDGSHAAVSGLAITPRAGGTGIRVLDSPSSAHAAVSLTLGMGTSVTGGARGFAVENANASVTATSDLSLSGQSGNYLELIANAGNVNATAMRFAGKTGVAMTTGELLAVENKIIHKPDNAALGKVTVLPTFDVTEIVIDDVQVAGDFHIPAGSKVVITETGSLTVTGSLTLAAGATLQVLDGDLVLPDGSVMSGLFTFFNSFGSVDFDGDVTISGSAEGLILVSDVHVADGATITVDGTFTIDGCAVDSPGSFDLVVNSTADFTMARTAFSDGTIIVNSGNTEIYDNRFTDMDIDVTASSTGARIFHNILSATADLDDAGTGTVTVVDAWGNVTDAANTENNLPLALELAPALITGNRTIDGDGVAYIQPGDAISAAFSVSALQNKIIGVEVLLGYNTDLLGAANLGLGTNWDDNTPFTEGDASNVIGRFNAAIGLDFTFPDPSGTDAPQTVGDLGLVAGSDEGVTQVFHRVKFASDTVPGTRLAKGLPGIGYLTPFTSNSPMIVIDETEPLTNTLLTGATIEQSGQDMTQFVTLQGILEISASAFDGLAGIDDADVVVTLVGPTTYTATQVAVTNPGPTIGSDVYTTYGFEYAVTSTTLNGDYIVRFTVTDRSGNTTFTDLGEITINKNEITATLELEGLVSGPVTRNVTFVFTDNNAEVDTRSESVVFTNGVGTVTFTDVNGETDQLSAKTATHLRERVPVVFTDGQASVTYADKLPGGDLNGDNVVNLLDYAVLRFYWLNVVGSVPAAAAAEITGDGSVNLTDYQILQSNFYQQGDPQ